jgi:hypothetical protein
VSEYNGWKNRQTWNVALWINNDEGLYRAAVNFLRNRPTSEAPYLDFIAEAGLENATTPDGVAWDDVGLDLVALDEMMRELV